MSNIYYPSVKDKIGQIRPVLYRQLCRELDKLTEGDPPHAHWKLLLDKLPTPIQDESGSRELNCADHLLTLLGNGQKTVGFLIFYLEACGSNDALAVIKVPIEISITEHPETPGGHGNVYEGGDLMLQCAATGFPKLEYCWYKGKDKLPCQTNPVLNLQNISKEDSGIYCCGVFHNIKGERRHKFTRTAEVHVVSPPVIPHLKTEPDGIRFVSHPSSFTINEKHTPIPLIAKAIGPGTITYKWFKNENEVEGVDGPCLNLHVTGFEDELIIQCQASNEYGQKALSKEQCKVTVIRDMFEAKDKVALLIGNMAYRSGPALNAARNDVENLAIELKKLQFKVFSFIDLSVEQMRKAVEIFCDLIVKDVYAVFYFAGHGFQKIGQCYLVAYDAPTGYPFTHCLCAEEVERDMQEKDPALSVVILDICREGKDPVDNVPLETFEPKPLGNRCLLYATTFCLNAYEDRLKNEGIMVTCLKEALRQDVNIDRMAETVKKVMKKNCLVEGIQIAETKSNVNESRSLKDPISGDPEILQKWQNAHTIEPKYSEERPYPITIPKVNIKVQVWCKAEHSNILTLHVRLCNLGTAEEVRLDFKENPSCGLVMQKVPQKERGHIALTLSDLQALQDDVDIIPVLSVRIFAKTQNSPEGKWYDHNIAIPLGKPLISALPIWRRQDRHTTEDGRRIPTEQEESNFTSSGAILQGRTKGDQTKHDHNQQT